ncbi:MAG: cobalamin biosynthesis protein [Thiotrichaceae bacterium]|nr:cobalamin biosynthesis protein [Thiotrichaceae bacterium]
MPSNHFIITPLILLMDHFFGEPVRWHPLQYFQQWAQRIEAMLNTAQEPFESYAQGVLAWATLIIPILLMTWFMSASFGWPMDILLVALAISSRALFDYIKRIPQLFADKDWLNIHKSLAKIGYQGAEFNDEKQLTRLSIEQFLLSTNSLVIGPLFWFWVGGIPMLIIYRLTRELDLLWGDRSQAHECFGKFVARLDDLLNFMPARLTALSWLLVGERDLAGARWKAQQTKIVRSLNSGLILTVAGASMNLKLGSDEQVLGGNKEPNIEDFQYCQKQFKKIIWIWLLLGLVIGLVV